MNWFWNSKRDAEIKKFKLEHPVGGLIVPENLDSLPTLGASSEFVAPTVVDERGHCTKTEDQGATSMCAAYATTSFAENIVWRRTQCPPSYDPVKVYQRAKELDGDNNGGTTLPHAMQAFLDVYPDVFDKSCEPKIINCPRGNFNDLKYAIHKYGCVVGGFNITDGWYNTYKSCKGWIDVSGGFVGGHAVLCCGYNENGIIIQNSWGVNFGESGFAVLPWTAAAAQHMYSCVLKGALKNMEE